MSGVETKVVKPIETHLASSELMPEEVKIEAVDLFYLNSLYDDLGVCMKRHGEIQQYAQQVQQQFQENQTEMVGTGKAIEKVIRIAVERKHLVGSYVFDKDKQVLVLKKDIQLPK